MAENSAVGDDEISLQEILATLRRHIRLLLALPLIVATLALGGSYLIRPTFTATTQIMPPQQSQGGAAALLGSLGGLGSLAGVAGVPGLKNPSDQWVGLLKSRTVADAIIKRFNLKDRYESEFIFEARTKLEMRTKISAGKDSLIDIEVVDEDPQLSAAIANGYVEELRNLSKTLAISEAAQRRLYFESQLKEAKENLIKAEVKLRESGISLSVLKTSPETAVAFIAQLQAQISTAEINLSVLRNSMTASSPLIQQANTELASLRKQLQNADASQRVTKEEGGGYIQKYRDLKYYETLFELMARQFELAKADEAKDGTLIQVVDLAVVPEWKSAPKRATIALIAYLATLILTLLYIALKPSEDGDRATK
jgi:tyrosine-protein kinase Etk/Wzc